MRIVLKVLYWLAVLIVSLALLVGLMLLLESRDDSDISGGVLLLSALLPFEAREHHDPLRRAVERVAGGQHEPLAPRHVGEPQGGARRDDLRAARPRR